MKTILHQTLRREGTRPSASALAQAQPSSQQSVSARPNSELGREDELEKFDLCTARLESLKRSLLEWTRDIAAQRDALLERLGWLERGLERLVPPQIREVWQYGDNFNDDSRVENPTGVVVEDGCISPVVNQTEVIPSALTITSSLGSPQVSRSGSRLVFSWPGKTLLTPVLLELRYNLDDSVTEIKAPGAELVVQNALVEGRNLWKVSSLRGELVLRYRTTDERLSIPAPSFWKDQSFGSGSWRSPSFVVENGYSSLSWELCAVRGPGSSISATLVAPYGNVELGEGASLGALKLYERFTSAHPPTLVGIDGARTDSPLEYQNTLPLHVSTPWKGVVLIEGPRDYEMTMILPTSRVLPVGASFYVDGNRYVAGEVVEAGKHKVRVLDLRTWDDLSAFGDLWAREVTPRELRRSDDGVEFRVDGIAPGATCALYGTFLRSGSHYLQFTVSGNVSISSYLLRGFQ